MNTAVLCLKNLQDGVFLSLFEPKNPLISLAAMYTEHIKP